MTFVIFGFKTGRLLNSFHCMTIYCTLNKAIFLSWYNTNGYTGTCVHMSNTSTVKDGGHQAEVRMPQRLAV